MAGCFYREGGERTGWMQVLTLRVLMVWRLTSRPAITRAAEGKRLGFSNLTCSSFVVFPDAANKKPLALPSG